MTHHSKGCQRESATNEKLCWWAEPDQDTSADQSEQRGLPGFCLGQTFVYMSKLKALPHMLHRNLKKETQTQRS